MTIRFATRQYGPHPGKMEGDRLRNRLADIEYGLKGCILIVQPILNHSSISTKYRLVHVYVFSPQPCSKEVN